MEIYTKDELYTSNAQPAYPDDATEAKFLLGGIGTGNVSVGSRGQLCDWELFNGPGKGNVLPFTFFALWTHDDKGNPMAKVLESQLKMPHERSHGYFSQQFAGIPRFRKATLKGEYPFATVDFEDERVPLEVTMEAFTPFIPLNADDSGIPGTVIRYRVKNTSAMAKPVSVAGSIANVVGYESQFQFGGINVKEEVRNEYRDHGRLRGINFTSPKLGKGDLNNGSLALITDAKDVSAKPEWLHTGWWDCIHDFWDDFCEDGRIGVPEAPGHGGEFGHNQIKDKVGSLAIHETIPAGGEAVFEFILTWYFPNRHKGWFADSVQAACGTGCDCGPSIETNYYATLWADAWEAAVYMKNNLPRLEGASRDFHRAMYSSTLPGYVLGALASNITVIRSTTCFRIADGTFLGWEGTFNSVGCCHGSCSHVWNYTQTMAFLFPELEMSMRRTEFLIETDNDGNMAFRAQRVLGQDRWGHLPATDGQLGTIIRLYRDWKFSGDDALLKMVWEKAGMALDFAFGYWDEDGDFVLESKQHNTYDIEFYGPNSLTNSIFFAALKAGAEMAEYLGDTPRAEKYNKALTVGSKKMDEILWGGEFYIQAIEDVNKYRYQYGKGCLSDQLLGQQLAHVAGLGHILPQEHVKQAVYSIYKYNFRGDMSDHHNVQRTYALNDEKGLLLCSWPNGGRPRFPFVYSDEVWTGIEYQVAAHLIYEGWIDEGLTVVKAVRERFNGYNRNPWNEIECGNHYARSLASWSLLTALSGYRFDLGQGKISFAPVISPEDFSCFFSTGKGWGIYRQTIDSDGTVKSETELLYGTLDGVTVN